MRILFQSYHPDNWIELKKNPLEKQTLRRGIFFFIFNHTDIVHDIIDIVSILHPHENWQARNEITERTLIFIIITTSVLHRFRNLIYHKVVKIIGNIKRTAYLVLVLYTTHRWYSEYRKPWKSITHISLFLYKCIYWENRNEIETVAA